MACPGRSRSAVTNAAHQVHHTYTTSDNFDIGTKLVSDSPTVVSGNSIDIGVLPFLNYSV
ncbi:hypothetical protein [Mycobacterium sp.]|uniref:hypothetical protein n=1 Tax=Mycobacterium sp. TaxID=1785 RepID=UPI003D0AB755